ncbi:MAG: glycosyltransferase family 2 protein [Epulopiscium sp.]|nr:glycosyltransferase family 2 protein [Candidatus Epulonipiscium sp.]
MTLAVIIPVYNEAKAIQKNFDTISSTFLEDQISCKYIIVDDGSSDSTWIEICAITNKYPHVSAIRFARNFGKEMALCAGIDYIEADRYLIMDSDLQHPPKYVKDMITLMDTQKVNIVHGIKKTRGKEKPLYKLLANSFYKILKNTTDLQLENSSDFKLLDHQVANAIRQFQESNLFFRGIVDWVGFTSATYAFEVDERIYGTSSFSTFKLIKLAINSVLSYTSKPLYLTIFSGIIFFLFSILLGLQTLANYFLGHAVSGFSTVILLLLFIGSMIMLSLGIIGLYIARIYDEVKQRPRYIVSNHIQCKKYNKRL